MADLTASLYEDLMSNSMAVPKIGGYAGYGNNGTNGNLLENTYSDIVGSNSNEGLLNDFMGGNGFGDMMGVGKGLWNMYSGYKSLGQQDDMMDMYQQQVDISQDKWNMTKAELNRLKGVRNNLTYGYNNGGDYSGKNVPQTA